MYMYVYTYMYMYMHMYSFTCLFIYLFVLLCFKKCCCLSYFFNWLMLFIVYLSVYVVPFCLCLHTHNTPQCVSKELSLCLFTSLGLITSLGTMSLEALRHGRFHRFHTARRQSEFELSCKGSSMWALPLYTYIYIHMYTYIRYMYTYLY